MRTIRNLMFILIIFTVLSAGNNPIGTKSNEIMNKIFFGGEVATSDTGNITEEKNYEQYVENETDNLEKHITDDVEEDKLRKFLAGLYNHIIGTLKQHKNIDYYLFIAFLIIVVIGFGGGLIIMSIKGIYKDVCFVSSQIKEFVSRKKDEDADNSSEDKDRTAENKTKKVRKRNVKKRNEPIKDDIEDKKDKNYTDNRKIEL